jgi:hypothetical protein
MMNEQVYSKDIVEFVTVGVEYCSLIERANEMERAEFNLKLVRMLPLLYLKATLLPADEVDEADELEYYVTEEQYEYLRASISKLLGEADDYLEVFEADMAYSDTPLAASISEALPTYIKMCATCLRYIVWEMRSCRKQPSVVADAIL